MDSLKVTGVKDAVSYASSDGFNDEELKDEWCDPENPRVIRCSKTPLLTHFTLHSFKEIAAAAYRIKDGVLMTSCDLSHMNKELNMELHFKKEYMQYTGSFKERGARWG